MKYTIGNYINRRPDNLLYSPSKLLVDNSTGIGIEVELEGVVYSGSSDVERELSNILDMWNIHKDGSLRGGTEFVFSNAFKGANIIKALDDLEAFITGYDNLYPHRPITISDRCSVHAHMDVRDFNDIDLRNFLMWYILFERILFDTVSVERIKNNNCRPVTDSDIIPVIGDLNHYLEVYSGDSERDRLFRLCDTVGRSCDKYSALNLLPINNYGSVEFRHHRGTKSKKDILDWINIILSLKKWSMENKISDFISKDIIRSIGIIELVFSETILMDRLDSSYFPGLLILGYYDVYQLLNHNELYNNIKSCRKEIIDFCTASNRSSTLLWRYKKANNLLVKKSLSLL